MARRWVANAFLPNLDISTGGCQLVGKLFAQRAEYQGATMLLHLAPAGLSEGHRVQAAGNDEPIPFNRVGDAGRIGLDRVQVFEGLSSLRLAAGCLIRFAHDAKEPSSRPR
jgi:hypothetical protein